LNSLRKKETNPMTHKKCPTCDHTYNPNRPHHCPPLWLVNIAPWDPNHDPGLKAVSIYSHYADLAAQEFVETYDNDQANALARSGQSLTVIVVSYANPADTQAFSVSGHTEYYYHTTATPRQPNPPTNEVTQ
jgi:hypothetical protein